MERPVPRLQIVLLGSSRAGKSSLARQLFYHRFSEDDVTLDEGSYCQQFEVDQDPCLLWLDMHNPSKVRPFYPAAVQGFLCVFSITDRESFQDLSRFDSSTMFADFDEPPPILLVGNKCDLEPERVVPTWESADLAKEWGCKYLETSAKANINVEACFFELVREIRRAAPANNPQPDNGKMSKRQCSLS